MIPFEHRPADDVYYRLLWQEDAPEPWVTVVGLQWFDESAYEPEQWVEDGVYTDHDAAWSAARRINNRNTGLDKGGLRELLAELVATVEGLADQQAMQDDWYLPVLERAKKALG